MSIHRNPPKAPRSPILPVWSVTLLVICTLFARPARATGGKNGDAAAVPDTSYRVKVEVREVKNRRVEGTVRSHKLYVDQPKQFGADDSAPTPPETLAFALGACMVSTGRLVAMQKKLPVRSIHATVEGELDFARALGMKTGKRAGYPALRLQVTIDGPLSASDKKRLLDEIAARCPMCDNLTAPTAITYDLKE